MSGERQAAREQVAQGFVGRERRQRDRLDPARAAALHAALDRPGQPPGPGEPLPPFWHWIYFWEAVPPGALGRDGHPRRDDGPAAFLPFLGLPRRMWAGGALAWHGPLRLGQEAERVSRIEAVRLREGRSGPLAFVTVHHAIRQDGRLAVEERQELVFRPDPDPARPAPPPPEAPERGHCLMQRRFDAVTLFRYSALTFNGHRIHYDRDYAREVEGYPGLVVHGPLIAQLLIDAAAALLGDAEALAAFRYRAHSPCIESEALGIFHAPGEDGLRLHAAVGRRLVMSAEARGRAR